MSEHKRVGFSTLDSDIASKNTSNTIGKSSQEATNKAVGLGGTNLKIGSFPDSLLSQRSAPPLISSTTTASGGNERAKKTIRLRLELLGTNSSTYPEFNYSKLIHLEKKKQKKLKQKFNGFVAVPLDDNDDDVARIAKELERKYGSSYASGRGKGKKDDQCDIGLGYDETDSFIDNTEAYDEIIPEEVETVEGGFYINSGALEFKQLSVLEKTDEIIKIPKKAKKRNFLSSGDSSSSSDETSTKKEHSGPVEKRSKPSSNEKIDKEDIEKIKEKKDIQDMIKSASSSNSPKRNIDALDIEIEKGRMKTVKTTTVKDMLKAKRDNFLKRQEGDHVVSSKSVVNGEVKGSINSSDDSSEDETDSCHNSDSNKDPNEKVLPTKPLTGEESTEKYRSSDTKIPDVSKEIFEYIQKMKDTAKMKNYVGKKFQFDDKLTEIFLKIDDNCLCLEKPKRNMIFAHLEYNLLLPKYYLLRKAKQLRVKDEKSKSKRALAKLRKIVDETMPTLLSVYDIEMKKYIEYQSISNNAGTASLLENMSKQPKKKFPWNEISRAILYDVYQIRGISFSVLRTKKESFDDFIAHYLKEKVLTIWPAGWMKYEELQKEIEKRKCYIKKLKEKKTLQSNSFEPTSTPQYIPSIVIDLEKRKENIELISEPQSASNSDKETSNKFRDKTLKSKFQNIDSVTRDNLLLQGTQVELSKTSSTVAENLSPTKRTDHSISTIMSSPSSSCSSASTTPQPIPCLQIHPQHSNKSAANTKTDSHDSPQIFNSVNDLLISATSSFNKCDPYEKVINIESLTTRRENSSSESDGVEIVGVFPPTKKVIPINKSKYKKPGYTINNQESQSNSISNIINLTGSSVSVKAKTLTGKYKNSSKKGFCKMYPELNSADFDVGKVVKVLEELQQQSSPLSFTKDMDQ